MSRQVAELRAALAGLDDEQRERLGRDWRRTIERKEEMKKPPILEGQTYFVGHAAPAPKKRSLPAEPATSPKPTTTKKGSV